MKKFILFSLAVTFGGFAPLQGSAGANKVNPDNYVVIEYPDAASTIKYYLPIKVAKLSRLFVDKRQDDDTNTTSIPTNVMSQATLEQIIHLMEIYANEIEEKNFQDSTHDKIRLLYDHLVETQSVSKETLEELLKALCYLNVTPLINTIHLFLDHNNQLTSLPAALDDLTNLTYLDLP